MPKRKASQQAISEASYIYEELFPRLSHPVNRFNDGLLVIDIEKHGAEGDRDYFRKYLRIRLKVSAYPYRYRGGLDLDLCFSFAMPRYGPGYTSYDYTSIGTVVIKREISLNWSRLSKEKAITSLASSCEGALRDGKLLSEFYIKKYVPVQAAVLEAMLGVETRTWNCRVLGELGLPWYKVQRPTKCLVHGEWNCKAYIQEWAKFHFGGREFMFKDMISNGANMRCIKSTDLRESLKKTTPMCEAALPEVEKEILSEEFKRKRLMRVVKPLFGGEKERGRR